MDISEIKDIAVSLKRHLEFLASAGITAVPKAGKLNAAARGNCPADWAIFNSVLSEASSFVPCVHEAWKGVLFGVWRLGKASAVWGVPVAGPMSDDPFGASPLAQLEKMLSWFAEQVKADKPDIFNPHTVLASRCPEAGGYSDTGAAEACAKNLLELLSDSKGLLIMGELTAWALLKTADLQGERGRVQKVDGCSVVVTFSPDDLVKDQELKKGAHADLKLLIASLGV